MESKNRVSLAVLLAIIAVLGATCFVPTAFACTHGNPVSSTDLVSDAKGEIIVKTAVSRLLLRDGVLAGGLRRDDGCSGSGCNILNDHCCSGCYCVPVGILVGVCVGSCC